MGDVFTIRLKLWEVPGPQEPQEVRVRIYDKYRRTDEPGGEAVYVTYYRQAFWSGTRFYPDIVQDPTENGMEKYDLVTPIQAP